MAVDIIQEIEEGKIHRFFRSRKKLGYAGLISHITQRAAGREPLFLEEDDYQLMLSLIRELAGKYRMGVLAYCLMPNHMHLLLRPEENNLQHFMRDVCGRYAARFNKRYERRGHLFGGPYRQALVMGEAYLLAASLYIHLNPVRAGLVLKPSSYRFSSCKLYVNEKPPRSFSDPKPVLALLAQETSRQREIYSELLGRGSEAAPGNVLEDEKALERFAGSLGNLFPEIFKGFMKERSPEQGESLQRKDFTNQINEDFDSIRTLRKPQSLAAKKYLIEQLIARGYTKSQVAEELGIARKTVYNLLG